MMAKVSGGGRVVCALVFALAAAAAAGCGKKGPPFVPIHLRETVLEYVRVAPARGGVLVSWKEAPKLPAAPEKKKWYGYRVMRGAKGEGPAEIGSVKLAGVDGMSYEFLDLTAKGGREYQYAVELLNEDRRIGYSSPRMSIVPGGGPAAPAGLKADGGDGSATISWRPADM